jgi:hypothetical protein
MGRYDAMRGHGYQEQATAYYVNILFAKHRYDITRWAERVETHVTPSKILLPAATKLRIAYGVSRARPVSARPVRPILSAGPCAVAYRPAVRPCVRTASAVVRPQFMCLCICVSVWMCVLCVCVAVLRVAVCLSVYLCCQCVYVSMCLYSGVHVPVCVCTHLCTGFCLTTLLAFAIRSSVELGK